MNNRPNQSLEFFEDEPDDGNLLWKYIQSMSPETFAQLSRPTSIEVIQIIEKYIAIILGNLPSEQFDVIITTRREYLGHLIATAIINGYFLSNAEKQMALEQP